MSAMDHELEEHDRGLAYDLGTLLERRRALKLFAGAGLVALVGCGAGTNGGNAERGVRRLVVVDHRRVADHGLHDRLVVRLRCELFGDPRGDGRALPGRRLERPERPLTESGIVRSDIRSSFGSSSGTAEGVPLPVELTVVDTANDCEPMAGAAVYLWHCDREGRYSLYSEGATDQNYLRGVQEADANGRVAFTSIFPAAYSGRWPHIHFEVYPIAGRGHLGR